MTTNTTTPLERTGQSLIDETILILDDYKSGIITRENAALMIYEMFADYELIKDITNA